MDRQENASLPPYCVRVSLRALCDNFRTLTAHLGAGVRPIAVVKADAYGHGAPTCVAALRGVGADLFAVSSLGEAQAIRAAAQGADILLLTPQAGREAAEAVAQGLCLTVGSREDLHEATVAAATVGRVARVHIKLDTGMHRLGFPASTREEIEGTCRFLVGALARRGLRGEGVFAHPSCADDPLSPETERQAALFSVAARALQNAGHCRFSHFANSAAAIRFGHLGCSGVRLGLALYGYAPSLAGLTLRPVMTSDAVLLRVFTLKRGERIGYGGSFCAPEDMRVGIAAVGYADGLLRACEGGHLLYKGAPVWFVGRISMDKCALSLGDLPARTGEHVTVFDETGKNLQQLARRARTIPYELLTLASRRAGRIYEND